MAEDKRPIILFIRAGAFATGGVGNSFLKHVGEVSRAMGKGFTYKYLSYTSYRNDYHWEMTDVSINDKYKGIIEEGDTVNFPDDPPLSFWQSLSLVVWLQRARFEDVKSAKLINGNEMVGYYGGLEKLQLTPKMHQTPDVKQWKWLSFLWSTGLKGMPKVAIATHWFLPTQGYAPKEWEDPDQYPHTFPIAFTEVKQGSAPPGYFYMDEKEAAEMNEFLRERFRDQESYLFLNYQDYHKPSEAVAAFNKQTGKLLALQTKEYNALAKGIAKTVLIPKHLDISASSQAGPFGLIEDYFGNKYKSSEVTKGDLGYMGPPPLQLRPPEGKGIRCGTCIYFHSKDIEDGDWCGLLKQSSDKQVHEHGCCNFYRYPGQPESEFPSSREVHQKIQQQNSQNIGHRYKNNPMMYKFACRY